MASAEMKLVYAMAAIAIGSGLYQGGKEHGRLEAYDEVNAGLKSKIEYAREIRLKNTSDPLTMDIEEIEKLNYLRGLRDAKSIVEKLREVTQ